MKNLFEDVTINQRDQQISNYITEHINDENNELFKAIKDVLENKLKQYQQKYPKLKIVNIKYESFEGDNIASVNEYDLNTIHVNLWRIIDSMWDNMNWNAENFYQNTKDFMVQYEDTYQLIGHELAHIIDYEYNGFKENIHDEDWMKIYEKITGMTPNPQYFVD